MKQLTKNQLRQVVKNCNRAILETANVSDAQRLTVTREAAFTAIKALQAGNAGLAQSVCKAHGLSSQASSGKAASTFERINRTYGAEMLVYRTNENGLRLPEVVPFAMVGFGNRNPNTIKQSNATPRPVRIREMHNLKGDGGSARKSESGKGSSNYARAKAIADARFKATIPERKRVVRGGDGRTVAMDIQTLCAKSEANRGKAYDNVK